MVERRLITRRDLLKGAAAVPAAIALSSCAPSSTSPSAAPSASPTPGEPVVFGVSAPLSGDNAEFGRIWQRAMTLRLEELNAAGGIKGRRVEVLFEDSQGKGEQAVAIAQKFTNDKKVLAEMGDQSSVTSMAASPIYVRGNMVQFGFTNSHPDFTKGGDFMFSTAPTQVQDAAYLAEVGHGRLGKTHAILFQNTDFGKATSGIYAQKIKDLGGQVVLSESYLPADKDFRPLIAKVRDAKPEVLVLISFFSDGALILQQARAAGVDTKAITPSSCYNPQFIGIGGAAVEGTVMTTTFFPGNPRPEAQKFVAAYKQRYNADPEVHAAGAYDALTALAWAVDKAGVERVAIKDALATGQDIPSIIYGPFRFGPDRRVQPFKVQPIQVKGGQFVAFS